MKKSVQKLFVFAAMVACLLVVTTGSAFPEAIGTAKITYDSNTIDLNELINLYADSTVQYSIVDSKSIGSVTNDIGYTLYELSPYGYAIISNDNNMIMEVCYSEGSSPPIAMDSRTEYYYIGLSSFVVKGEDGRFVDKENGIELDQTSINNLASIENYILTAQRDYLYGSETANRSSTNTTVITQNVAEDYFSNLSNFGYNTEGTCTIIAIAILLGYYDCYVYDGYVDDPYMNYSTAPYGTNEDFHLLLCDYVNATNPTSTYIYNARLGINNYLSDQVIVAPFAAPEMYNIDANRNLIVEQINHGHPVVSSMATLYGASYDHSVVVYGYRYTTTGDNTTNVPDDTLFRVHYGWHNSNYDVLHSSAWFYAFGYMADCTNIGTHYYQSSSTGNTRILNGILLYEKLRICSSCGYTDTTWSKHP